MTSTVDELQRLSKLLRHWILTSGSAAGSGHPTSSLSAVELMTALSFGGKPAELLEAEGISAARIIAEIERSLARPD